MTNTTKELPQIHIPASKLERAGTQLMTLEERMKLPAIIPVTIENIPEYKIAEEETEIIRKLQELLHRTPQFIGVIGNIGLGKTSIMQLMASHIMINALPELPENPNFIPEEAIKRTASHYLMKLNKCKWILQKHILAPHYENLTSFETARLAFEQINTTENSKKEEEKSAQTRYLQARSNVYRTTKQIQYSCFNVREYQAIIAREMGRATLTDGLPFVDVYGFSATFKETGTMMPRDFDEIENAFKEKFVKKELVPDFIVYITGSVQKSLKNIGERGRQEVSEGEKWLVSQLDPWFSRLPKILSEKELFGETILEINTDEINFVKNAEHRICVYKSLYRALTDRKWVDEHRTYKLPINA